MARKLSITGDGDFSMVGVPIQDRWTVEFQSDGAASPILALGGATVRFFGYHFDPVSGERSEGVPLQNGMMDDTATDDDGNSLLSIDVYSGFSGYFVRVTGFTVPFDIWYGPT